LGPPQKTLKMHIFLALPLPSDGVAMAFAAAPWIAVAGGIWVG
jgi:hypothetical protein